MKWQETGVLPGSTNHYFNPGESFRSQFYYMKSFGHFYCNDRYDIHDRGAKPPLLFFVADGTLHVEYEGKSFEASKNDAVLLNCRMKHRYCCSDQCEFVFFHFDGPMAETNTDYLIKANGSPLFHQITRGGLGGELLNAVNALDDETAPDHNALSALVYRVLCRLENQYKEESGYSDLITDAVNYINDHVRENFTVESLADRAGLSLYYFSRKFKKETGTTAAEYIALSKIGYSRILLKTSSLSVAEIAEFLGYASSASYINAFKARTGISPLQYRRSADTV